jgi:hypothetical protein
MASPEIVQAYERRYGAANSLIASALAARPVNRRPKLVFLGTTSLYGVGSSQYNRIAIPAGEVGGRPGKMLRFEELGPTEGYGLTNFSPQTSAEIEVLLDSLQKSRERGKTTNSIFGEGVSPRMRKLRTGLEQAGLPSEQLLQHGTPRIVYGVPLTESFRDILLGRIKQFRYLFPTKNPLQVTGLIAEYWRKRWLAMRVENNDRLDQVERHTLAYPVVHGARVVLPPSGERTLFDFT